jgi:hypothetical protein
VYVVWYTFSNFTKLLVSIFNPFLVIGLWNFNIFNFFKKKNFDVEEKCLKHVLGHSEQFSQLYFLHFFLNFLDLVFFQDISGIEIRQLWDHITQLVLELHSSNSPDMLSGTLSQTLAKLFWFSLIRFFTINIWNRLKSHFWT